MGGRRAIVTADYAHLYRGKWRWVPPPWARRLGAHAETLTDGPDLTGAAADRANALARYWRGVRDESRGENVRDDGTISALIRAYERSAWYDALAPKTKLETDQALREINAAIGRYQVAALARRHVRQFHDGAVGKWSPNKANKLVKWLRRLLSYAVETDRRPDNPALGLRLTHNPPRRQKWTVAEVAAVRRAARRHGRPSLALAIRLAYDSAQRLGDILALQISQFDGEGISVVQAKTGREVWAPLAPSTCRAVECLERDVGNVVVNDTDGRPYANQVTFNRHFRAALVAAGVRGDLQFRDLRRTAITEIRARGVAANALSGHAPGSNMDRVYFVPDRDAARHAQAARRAPKRERKTNDV